MKPRSGLLLTLVVADTRMDSVLRECVAPLLRPSLGDPRLAAAYFHRHVKPEWNLKIVVRCADGSDLADEIAARAHDLIRPIDVRSWETGNPPAEARAGVERLFHHDTAACLDLLDRETAGDAGRTRREFSLLMTERVLDLLRLDREARLEFYRLGHQRPFRQGTWGDDDRPILEGRYRELGDALTALLDRQRGESPDVWGGAGIASIATRCLAASRPHLESLARESRTMVPLAHALCQRHCNRLGIDGLAEAVLRYLVFRLYEDRRLDA